MVTWEDSSREDKRMPGRSKAEKQDLGARAKACPGWRWRAGMASVNGERSGNGLETHF